MLLVWPLLLHFVWAVRRLGNSGHRLVTVYWKAKSGVYVNASQYFEFHKLLGRWAQNVGLSVTYETEMLGSY